VDEYAVLRRYLSAIRLAEFERFTRGMGLTPAAAQARLAPFDAFAKRFGAAVSAHEDILTEMTDTASALKERAKISRDHEEERQMLRDEAKKTSPDRGAGITGGGGENRDGDGGFLIRSESAHRPAARNSRGEPAVDARAGGAPADVALEPGCAGADQARKIREFSRMSTSRHFPRTSERWPNGPPIDRSRCSRRSTPSPFGREWITASFWQDWYGILPLLLGSVFVSVTALAIAIPFGLCAAIYVNQLARPWEQRLIKPYVEFISAIPSVVLGFFGITVLGETLRQVSQSAWLAWVPGFPMRERLTAFTAASLLALMAIPTIFTLAEDALNNVPRAYKEASLALGSTRLQTIFSIISSGRVIGHSGRRAARFRARDRRDDGGAALRRKIGSRFRICPPVWVRFSSPCTR